ncbi:MAG: alpha/beta hydrolase [Candidatus Paceibacterota bacterium]|jgi:pimeloyl-ACP methyl ester carboxylesterase
MKEHIFEPKGIYYRTNEFRDGRPTIVFMHGLSGHSGAWLPYEEFLGNNYNILTFDLRGHGLSQKFATYHAYKIASFADDLFELVQLLNIGKFTLITHSFGCLIALEFAKHHQVMLGKLVLMSPSFSVDRPIARLVKPLLTMSRVLELLPFRASLGSHFDYLPHQGARDWNIPMTLSDVRNTGLRAYLFASRQAFEANYEDILGNIEIPVLLIHGRKDSIFPIQNSFTMEKIMPQARMVILEDGDHIIIVNTSYFQRIKDAIVDFVI